MRALCHQSAQNLSTCTKCVVPCANVVPTSEIGRQSQKEVTMSYSAITPFAAAKVANIMLRQNGLDIEIRPQMMYNYAKKNLIASNYETRSADEKIYFDGD